MLFAVCAIPWRLLPEKDVERNIYKIQFHSIYISEIAVTGVAPGTTLSSKEVLSQVVSTRDTQ